MNQISLYQNANAHFKKSFLTLLLKNILFFIEGQAEYVNGNMRGGTTLHNMTHFISYSTLSLRTF